MEAKTYYLLTFKDQNSHQIFYNNKNKKLFLRLYEHFLVNDLNTYAWSILPGKAYFLCSAHYDLKEAPTLKEVIVYQKDGFENLINLFNDYLKQETSPGIFIDAKAKPLDQYPDSFLSGFSSYIHCMPIFHGLTNSFIEYGWTSYLPLLHQKFTFLHCKTVLGWFGGKEEYQKFHHQMLEMKKARDLCRNTGKFY